MSEFDRIGTNSGHGHAWARPDGVKARCGGVGLCRECARDFALVNRAVQKGADTTAADLVEVMKGQLLIVLVERLQRQSAEGEVRVPVEVIDGTGGKLLGLRIDGTDFVFSVQEKN